MADYPSSSVTKRLALGTVTAPTVASTVGTTGSTAVNLATQALPIQGGLLGNFGGATVVGTVAVEITGAGGTVEIGLQGSHDNTTWFNIPPSAAAAAVNRFTVTSPPAGCPSGLVGQVACANFNGPLPQYIKGSLVAGTVAPGAGTVALNVIVNG